MSYPFASRYIDQFPKDKTVQVSRFVAFVTGALAAVLALASVIDPELFLGFEITADRTVLFYLGVFGTVWAVARGIVPEETLVFDPEYALNNVIEYTHYQPAHWRGRLHSDEVRKEFTRLYQLKIMIFAEELLSLIFTPFILWFSLPKCSDRLVDFFREFTLHVDGLGYVCSFAVFDFKLGANSAVPRRPDEATRSRLREEYYSTKDGKMLASYYGFIDNYSNNPRAKGAPPPTGPRRPYQASAVPPGPAGPVPAAMAPEMSGAGRSRPERSMRAPAGTALADSIAQARRAGLAPTPSARDPAGSMPSMLLDPQALSASRRQPSPRQRTPARHSPSSHPLAQHSTEGDLDAEDSSAQPGGVGVTSSGSAGATGDDSNLGESWKTTRAAATGDEDEEDNDKEHIDGMAGDREVGVLGLLYQFQRAHTEGRGGGVGI